MNKSQPKYLLRFDDICPTMNWQVWDEIELILSSKDIKPIIAVVPDNRDPKLIVAPAKACFWEWVRARQLQGWSIALHGYQHQYVNRNAGIMRLTPQSEFAGLPRAEQKEKLERGIEIFRREGVRIDAWVAPSHSFDWTTVELLAELGINVISDGLWPWPHTDDRGITWVPQQMWSRFKRRPTGLWTACYHHNGWSPKVLAGFRHQTEKFASQITCLSQVLDEYRGRRLTFADRSAAFLDIRFNRPVRRWVSRLLGL